MINKKHFFPTILFLKIIVTNPILAKPTLFLEIRTGRTNSGFPKLFGEYLFASLFVKYLGNHSLKNRKIFKKLYFDFCAMTRRWAPQTRYTLQRITACIMTDLMWYFDFSYCKLTELAGCFTPFNMFSVSSIFKVFFFIEVFPMWSNNITGWKSLSLRGLYSREVRTTSTGN